MLQACILVDHNQLFPLPFKTIHTNTMLVLKSQSACATTKTSAIMEYIILNGKVVELVVVYMGTVKLPFFNSSIQHSWLFINKTFLLVSSAFLVS